MRKKDIKINSINEKPTGEIHGFKSENLSIRIVTKENTQINHRINRLLSTPYFKDLSEKDKNIVTKITSGYRRILTGKPLTNDQYVLADHELVEFEKIHDRELFRYLIYRYKYNIYPKLKMIDDYPPCVQIEIASVCNFRCIFCYQTDKNFTSKNSGFMGYMDFDLFKNIIDQLEGNVESITLASRGEPTLHKELGRMLKYVRGKFLATKINTNASLLNDNLIHTILSNDIQSIVFSIDAADKDLYEKFRVNGKFEKTLKNIQRFVEIKEKEYLQSRLITRITGVKVNDLQNIDEMINIWSPYGEIVSFTNYTPWESSYENPVNEVTLPCTELWRRLFVWWDGKVNPCDYDYKSLLSKWNILDTPISEIWNSNYYNKMREKHLNKQRKEYEPCNRCISI